MKNHDQGNKPNICVGFGLILNGIMSMLNHYVALPDFVHGMTMGIAIGLIAIGLYGYKCGFKDMKEFKKKIFNKE